MNKICKKCKVEKDISEFYKHHITKDGYYNFCKPCKAKVSSEHYQKNKKKIIANIIAYQKSKPKKVKLYKRRSDLKKKYNLSKEQYDQMYMLQLGLCAVCHNPFGEETPCVDHCHITNKVRGLIHDKCNRIMGQANDDIRILQWCIEYLQKHQNDSCSIAIKC